MTRIPETTIQAIIDKSDIVAIVGEHVRLVRSGKEYKGLCPFHSEKTASFYVVPEKNIFYCFGCGKGGDAVKFLMEFEKMSYPEALRELARRAGIEMDALGDAETPEADKERQSLFELFDRLSKTFAWILDEQPWATKARELLRSRAISVELQHAFRLGYAPRDRHWLKQFLFGKGYTEKFLVRSGLFSAQHPDFPLFSDRLIFPIMDAKGRCVSFGGRLLDGEGPKYINGPETSIFRKQDHLFALDKARDAIREANSALVCEGYMDALSFHSAGMKTAVAPLGTAFTERQAKVLRRLADVIVFSFDSDPAGQNAAARSLPIAAQVGMDARVALLPGGKDPSEILEKEGPESLHKIDVFTISGGDFIIRRAKDLFDIGTVEGKAKAAASLMPYAAALDSEVKRDAFFDLASRRLRMEQSSLRVDFERERKAVPSAAPSAVIGKSEAGPLLRRSPEFVFMLAVTVNFSHFARVRSLIELQNIDDSRARELYIALEECYRADSMGLHHFIERIAAEDLRKAVMEAAASGEFDEQTDRLIEDGILNARKRGLERKKDRILELLDEGDGMSLQELLEEKMHLDAELAKLKDERDERS